MQLTPGQVAWLVLRAGWRDDAALEAAAVCWAESFGRSHLVTGGPPFGNHPGVGLFQLDVARFPGLRRFDLLDPLSNTRAAHSLWLAHASTFTWSPAWLSGAWLAFTQQAADGLAAPTPMASIGDDDLGDAAGELDRAVASDMRLAAEQGGPPAGELPGGPTLDDHL